MGAATLRRFGASLAVVFGLGLTNLAVAAELKAGDPAPAFSMMGSDARHTAWLTIKASRPW